MWSLPGTSAAEVARLTRRVAWGSGALTVAAFASLLPALPYALPVAAALALAGVALVVLRRLVVFGGALVTAALALALGGLVPLPFLLPAALAALVAPLYGGTRARALALAWRASGARARSPFLHAEALARDPEDALSPTPWRRAPLGALARYAEGFAQAGLALTELIQLPFRPRERLVAEASLDDLARELAAHGATVERSGGSLLVRLPPLLEGAEGGPVRVKAVALVFPPSRAVDLRGARADVRRLRKLFEGPLAHALLLTHSRPARRWERRIHALAAEARHASSLEERSLVMEELDRVRRALAERDLSPEEARALALKEATTRAMLAHRMLSEPPGPRSAHALSQHGAVVPDLARVLDAGGLSAVKRVAFVPHWIVPVETPWGPQEVAVNAALGRVDLAQSHALLAAMRARGPALLLDVGAQPVFLPAPPPTAALVRELRGHGLFAPAEAVLVAQSADVVYVPYLATAEGYVSGVTGAPAPDLGNAVPVAPA